MNHTSTPLYEYYFLKNKQSFSINPMDDAAVYFGDRSLEDRLIERIESDIVQPRSVPKFFVHGAYGSGKTHTLEHVAHVLKHPPYQGVDDSRGGLFPSETLYLNIAPLRQKDRYVNVHTRLLDAIGIERAQKAAQALASRLGHAELVDGIRAAAFLRYGDEALQASQARVFRNLLLGGRVQTLSWEWLKGQTLSMDDRQTLEVQKNLTEPADLVAALLNLAAAYYFGLRRKLVLLIDEAETFGNVQSADSLEEFRFVFTELMDDRNDSLGLIIAIMTDGGMEDVPRLFTADAIRRRVGFDQGYIDLTGLVSHVDDARHFMAQVLEYLIDQDKAKEMIGKEDLATSPEWFPFTDEAIEVISDYVSNNPERALPSYIITIMAQSAVNGWRKRSSQEQIVLVDEELANQALFPDRH